MAFASAKDGVTSRMMAQKPLHGKSKSGIIVREVTRKSCSSRKSYFKGFDDLAVRARQTKSQALLGAVSLLI